MARITKQLVDSTKPGRDRAFLWDDRLPGFGLLVLPSGSRSFLFQYRTREGRSRRITIAKVGTMAPEQARVIAQGFAHMVRTGGDPLADKQAARDALTVGELLDAYVASPHYATKAPSTRATGKGQIAAHLRPLLGRRYTDKLTQDDIRRCFASIRDGRTAKSTKTGPRGLSRVTGGEGAARYACRLLRAAFQWAVAERLIERDPSSGVAFGGDGMRDTVLDGPGYTRLFETLATMEAARRLRPAVADAIRIIAMTGARRGEVTGLRWNHVDLQGGRIVLPPSAHKTGAKTGAPRVIALPAAAQAIISRQPASDPAGYVFLATKGDGPISLAKPWDIVRREASLPAGIGLHALRHSVATSLAISGAAAPEIMATLGHRQLSTVARYLHFQTDARAALAERAAAPALAGMAAAAGMPRAAILPLPKRRGR
jgi:integrase